MNNLSPWQPMLYQMLTTLQKRCSERDKNCYVTMQDGQMGGVVFLIHSSYGIEAHEIVEDMNRRLVVAY